MFVSSSTKDPSLSTVAVHLRRRWQRELPLHASDDAHLPPELLHAEQVAHPGIDHHDALRGTRLLFPSFSPQNAGESPLPEVDGRNGLVRCSTCWAYMNPHCRFTQGGHQFVCNLCGTENETPSWYFATTDSAGNRFDRAERPELSRGAIDILAGKEFYEGDAQSPIFAFVIDVTRKAQESGVFSATVSSIEACVESLKDDGRARIGICAVDTQVHMLTVSVGIWREFHLEWSRA